MNSNEHTAIGGLVPSTEIKLKSLNDELQICVLNLVQSNLNKVTVAVIFHSHCIAVTAQYRIASRWLGNGLV